MHDSNSPTFKKKISNWWKPIFYYHTFHGRLIGNSRVNHVIPQLVSRAEILFNGICRDSKPAFRLFISHVSWRIIPVSMWLVTPIYKPLMPFGRGTTLLKGLTNHGYWPLTNWDDSPSSKYTSKKLASASPPTQLLEKNPGKWPSLNSSWLLIIPHQPVKPVFIFLGKKTLIFDWTFSLQKINSLDFHMIRARALSHINGQISHQPNGTPHLLISHQWGRSHLIPMAHRRKSSQIYRTMQYQCLPFPCDLLFQNLKKHHASDVYPGAVPNGTLAKPTSEVRFEF